MTNLRSLNPTWDIMLVRPKAFEILSPKITYMLNINNPKATYVVPHIYPPWNIMFTRFWLFMTSSDLWPAWKIIRIICSIRTIHMSSMRSLTAILLEIQCLQHFDRLTTGDPKWPLTSTKNYMDHLLNMGNQYAKYEIPHSYHSWDKVFTTFWPFDHWWPQMTFDLHQKS